MLQSQRDKTGTYLPTEKYESMMVEIESTKAMLGECEGALGQLRTDLEEEKTTSKGLKVELADTTHTLEATSYELSGTQAKLTETEGTLTTTTSELTATKVVVREQVATEAALTSEATLLQESLDKADADVQGLFSKVGRATSHAEQKTNAAAEFGASAVEATAALRAQSAELDEAIAQSGEALRTSAAESAAATDAAIAALLEASATADQSAETTSTDAATSLRTGCESTATKLAGLEADASARLQEQARAVAHAATALKEQQAQAAAELEAQREALAKLSASMAQRAADAEKAVSSFVVANCDALRLTRSAMSKEMEAHIASLSEQQQSLLAFATAHKAQVIACVEAVAEDREATNAKLNGVLATEEAAALKRIAAEEEKAEARAEALQEEGAEFMAQVQALMTAFTAKHAAGSRAQSAWAAITSHASAAWCTVTSQNVFKRSCIALVVASRRCASVPSRRCASVPSMSFARASARARAGSP